MYVINDDEGNEYLWKKFALNVELNLHLVFRKCNRRNMQNCRKCVTLNYEAAISLITLASLLLIET